MTSAGLALAPVIMPLQDKCVAVIPLNDAHTGSHGLSSPSSESSNIVKVVSVSFFITCGNDSVIYTPGTEIEQSGTLRPINKYLHENSPDDIFIALVNKKIRFPNSVPGQLSPSSLSQFRVCIWQLEAELSPSSFGSSIIESALLCSPLLSVLRVYITI